jgi:hypothetical protein
VRGPRGRNCRQVSHGEDSIEGSPCGQCVNEELRLLEADWNGIVSPGIFQDVATVRGQDELHVERASGLGKLPDLISGGRGDQEYALHA